MSKEKPFVVISSGGTGGHMSPASALASDLIARGFRVELFTDVRGQKFQGMFKAIPVHVLKAGTFGSGLSGKIKGVFYFLIGVLQAFFLLRRLKPDLVVGFGGYPSVPGVLAAQYIKTPTVLHEQNAIIGKANAFLAPRAERIALSLPQIHGLDQAEILRSVITGNPVRPEIADLYLKPYTPLGLEGEMRILVMGGSLGATVFSEIVPHSLARLSVMDRKRLKVMQQCRASDIEEVRRVYAQAGIDATLVTFFDNVAEQLQRAHLVIARSGASTVAEVSAAGRPAIFVPYPHHKDQQQKMNADAVADSGGAWVMTEDGFTQESLHARIETFMQNPEILFHAAEKARAFGKPDAARKLGNVIVAVISGWDGNA